MIEALNHRLAGMLPLLVREATFEDPSLTLVGDGWALSKVDAQRRSIARRELGAER